MRRPLIRLSLAVALLAASAAAAPAQDARGANRSEARVESSPEARGVDQLVLAARLADWGRRRGDARALILAARIAAETPVRAVGLEGRSEGGRPSERPEALDPTPAGLLQAARGFAEGDADLLAEIAAVEAAQARGVVSSAFGRGPIVAVRDIEAQATYWFEIEARGGEVLRVAAIGDGDTDIDLIVRDEFGATVCADTAYDHYPVCTLAPAFDGRFRVDIINHGRVWTRTQILSN